MKRIVIIIAALAISAAYANAQATPEQIQAAENTPAAAKHFVPCPKERPSGSEANKSGLLIVRVENGRHMQYGTSRAPAESYDFYCGGRGGKGSK